MTMENGFVSDDGSSFTVIKDDGNDDKKIIDDNDDVNDSDPLSLINKVDVSSLPEEQRPVFNKLIETLKTTLSEVSSLREKSDIAAALKQTLESMGTQRKVEDKQNDGQVSKPKLSDSLKFEDGDYYAPFFKQVATVLDSITDKIDGLGNEVKQGKVTSFQNKVVDFIKSNKVPEKVVMKMDELAKTMGPGVYNDLYRLHKLANLELGIVDVKKQDREDINRKISNGVETRSRMRSNGNTKQDAPPKNMREAWALAEGQLVE